MITSKATEAELPPVLGPLPEDVASFFDVMSTDGFPEDVPKAQPWKEFLKKPHNPSPDGKLILACPKKCLYGRFSVPRESNILFEADTPPITS